jgi:hypothetical protein
MDKSKKVIVLLVCPIVALVFPAFLLFISLKISNDLRQHTVWAVGMLLRFAFLFLGVFWLVRLFLKQVIQSKMFSKSIEGLFITYYAVFIALIVLEIATTFWIKTNPIEDSLSTLNWYAIYGGPKNSQKFRDEEFTMKKEKLAVFMGDSFTQGFGINNYEKRFSNLVEANTNYETWNLGIQGADVKTYVGMLLHSTKYIPDVLYLQFYFNDITTSGYKFNHHYRPQKAEVNCNTDVIKSSYLLNHIYVYQQVNKSTSSDYISYINQLVLDREVWNDHSADIQNIKKICDSLKTEMRAIVFPYMVNPALSNNYTQSLKAVLDSLRVPTIHVDELILELTPKQRTVNRHDAHASTVVNKRIAEKIIEDLENKKTLLKD